MGIFGRGTRHRRRAGVPEGALLVLAARLAAVVAAGGFLAAPAVAHADNPPGVTERSGPVYNNPGYTWDVIVDNAGTQIVTITLDSVPWTAWASWNGGPWYITSGQSQWTIWTLADASQIPSFMDPSSADFGMFVNQLLPPQPLPDSLFPPPGTPPTLNTDDPGTDPGSIGSDDPPGTDVGDFAGGTDPGGDPGGGIGDDPLMT
jgi:hypothetical protein